MTRRRKNEEPIHRACADFLARALPTPGALWFHCPNGGGRSKAEAGALKALGVTAGIPDLCIITNLEFDRERLAVRRLPYPLTLWIEIKPETGRLSEAQRAMRAELEDLGHCWELARSVDHVEQALRRWDVPLRASVLGLPTIRQGEEGI